MNTIDKIAMRTKSHEVLKGTKYERAHGWFDMWKDENNGTTVREPMFNMKASINQGMKNQIDDAGLNAARALKLTEALALALCSMKPEDTMRKPLSDIHAEWGITKDDK